MREEVRMIESSAGRELRVGEDGKEIGNSHRGELALYDGCTEPFVGMEFESDEAAMKFYDEYARRVGFIIRVGSFNRCRDGTITSRRFLCNKEGFHVSHRGTARQLEVRKPRAIIREGCKAMINVKKQQSGIWVVTRFIKDHSHQLGISTGKARQSLPQIRSQDEKDKKIRELYAELQRERRRYAMYLDHLLMVLKDIDEHTQHISDKVQDVVHNIAHTESQGHKTL